MPAEPSSTKLVCLRVHEIARDPQVLGHAESVDKSAFCARTLF
jgi:hypothetical protein